MFANCGRAPRPPECAASSVWRSQRTGPAAANRRSPSSEFGKWQISTGGGRYPIWSRNGRELFYYAPDTRIMVTTYTPKADSFAADKPRPWSNTQILQPNIAPWSLDLAPGGKRFAVFPRPDATGEQKGSVRSLRRARGAMTTLPPHRTRSPTRRS